MLSGPLVLGYLVATLDTLSNGLFLQTRVGQFGKPFTIFKFRTIHPQSGKVSAIGAFLRKSKIDELPQLLNVLTGDMSIVGPRPEVPRYVALYPAAVREEVLSVRPGVTDLASVQYRSESSLLAASSDP